jgi:hypothetical protein
MDVIANITDEDDEEEANLFEFVFEVQQAFECIRISVYFSRLRKK